MTVRARLDIVCIADKTNITKTCTEGTWNLERDVVGFKNTYS
jgi:hypothetical protein